jgi:crotonobetainyl-CoA:carnitine CoA-transferase CaiB-like acyl-CoA transferase
MAGALSHIRILDLSRILAGPTTTQVLADLGAEVIKIERPEVGDDTRQWVPPVLRNARGEDTGEAAYYACVNRNKKSVTVNISKPAGQDIIRRLAAKSDVMIENYIVGTLKRYDLDYDSLKAINPGLIYCSVTGFGQTGPYAARAGYDPIMQAMGGLMSVTGERDAKPGGGPQRVGISISDLLTGAYAAIGILAALQYRERSGRGQYVDMALFDCMIAALSNVAMNYLATGEAPRRLGNAHPNLAPSGAFACSDGHIQMLAGNDSQFGKLCEVAGRPELAADARFATNAARVGHRDELNLLINQITVTRTMREWNDALAAAGVPCGPINNLAQVFQDPQVLARGMLIELDHPLAGAMRAVANPVRLSETPPEYRSPPPLLGQHTREVLRDLLGMNDSQIDALVKAQVV